MSNPICEKCWSDAGGMAERYSNLVSQRNASGPHCTPEQQAGPEAGECPACKRRTMNQHVTDHCMVPFCQQNCPPATPHEPAQADEASNVGAQIDALLTRHDAEQKLADAVSDLSTKLADFRDAGGDPYALTSSLLNFVQSIMAASSPAEVEGEVEGA